MRICKSKKVIMNLDPIDICPKPAVYQRSNGRESHLYDVLSFKDFTETGAYYFEMRNIRYELRYLTDKFDKIDIKRKKCERKILTYLLENEHIIDKKISDALDVYDSDKIGLYDYAALYAGGSVISTPNTSPYLVEHATIFLINMNFLSDPKSILQPTTLPGNCFAFDGTEGRVRIKLARKIEIKAVTMEHIRLDVDRSSAPREFRVYGLPHQNGETPEVLGTFTYQLTGRPYQTFQIVNNDTKAFEIVELHILNNYGKDDYTCIYRFRVHGNYTEY
ncbi:SUN domain-containing protein 1 isoform X2 [Diabrotica virgifera virgifera]|uniref:SUN domain-containing protein 1-like isoform X2 n=1 Tax=Diabrotica virgifera virgifera TaxID=50390 RepID=A0A6P7FES3_DIAVI|nr:SUN domain-containing protein 1 isoform X2 [Diabrotica virgifera virgifera]